jgi:hypothetical protein
MVEIQISPNSLLELPTVMMGLSVISILLFTKYAAAIARQKLAMKDWAEHFCRQLVALLVCLQVLLWQLCNYSSTHDKMAMWCVVVAVACGVVFWRVLHVPLKSLLPTSRTIQMLLAIVTAMQVAGFIYTSKRFMEPVDAMLFAGPAPGELVEDDRVQAYTDLGTRLSVFLRDITEERFQQYVMQSRAAVASIAEQSITRAAPQPSTNCHGWVFTDGKYILRSADVQTVLNENGYLKVESPQDNDVVIYRDSAGRIIHSGLVRSVLSDGSVLIESKWGFASTYIHMAVNQPYSSDFSYYHTPRGSHTIQISAVPEPSMAVKAEASNVPPMAIN